MMQSSQNPVSSPPRIIGRTRRLLLQQRGVFDWIFHSGGGYVLNFTDRTMAEWFDENFDLDIFQARFQIEGGSKGKTLRGFVEVAEPRLVARVLRKLWEYRCLLGDGYVETDPNQEKQLKAWLEQFASELEEAPTLNFDEAFRDFSGDTSLQKLRASIENDLLAERHNVAVDRIHTYCVRRFRALLSSRGQDVNESASLDTLFSAYSRGVRDEGTVSEFAFPLLSVQHKTFYILNQTRNRRSLAHGNELLDASEAKFIIDCVLASLSFIGRLEDSRQEPITNLNDEIPF